MPPGPSQPVPHTKSSRVRRLRQVDRVTVGGAWDKAESAVRHEQKAERMHRVGQGTCRRRLNELRRRHLATGPAKDGDRPSPSSLTTAIASRLTSSRARLASSLSDLSSNLSRLTGYEAIDALKMAVVESERQLRLVREGASGLKRGYDEAVERRSKSMKEVNDLLSRKNSWSDEDLARFTTLVRTDHANEQAESAAKTGLEEVESKVDAAFTGLMQAILARYHEEQVWSDKIRSLSTTFSISVTVINVLVFLLAIVIVEPYKRAKVVEGVETRLLEREEKKTEVLDRALGEVVDRLSATESRLETVLAGVSPRPQHAASPTTAGQEGEGDGPGARREKELVTVLGAGAALGAVLVGVAQVAFGR